MMHHRALDIVGLTLSPLKAKITSLLLEDLLRESQKAYQERPVALLPLPLATSASAHAYNSMTPGRAVNTIGVVRLQHAIA